MTGKPIVCTVCGAPWGERRLLVPGDVTRTIPTPDGEIEVVIQDHAKLSDCLEILRKEAESQKQLMLDAERRMNAVMARHNSLVDRAKQDKERRQKGMQ